MLNHARSVGISRLRRLPYPKSQHARCTGYLRTFAICTKAICFHFAGYPKSARFILLRVSNHSRWTARYVYSDRLLMCWPPCSEDAALMLCNAESVVPGWPPRLKASRPMRVDERRTIGVWLKRIGENDPATLDAVREQCNTDDEAREYYLSRAMQPATEDGQWHDSTRS